MSSNRWISILWPSFVVAGGAEAIFFTVINPQELYLFGEPVDVSSLAAYSIGFFLFWAVAAASSAFTCLLQKSADEINQCPLEPAERPVGCPKRDDPRATCP